jgi:hypothetical protein
MPEDFVLAITTNAGFNTSLNRCLAAAPGFNARNIERETVGPLPNTAHLLPEIRPGQLAHGHRLQDDTRRRAVPVADSGLFHAPILF